jgi:hypothetical protein
MLGWMQGKKKLRALLVGTQVIPDIMEISRRFMEKLRIELSYDPT